MLLMFLPHFDDLLPYKPTASWNPYILDDKKKNAVTRMTMSSMCVISNRTHIGTKDAGIIQLIIKCQLV